MIPWRRFYIATISSRYHLQYRSDIAEIVRLYKYLHNVAAMSSRFLYDHLSNVEYRDDTVAIPSRLYKYHIHIVGISWGYCAGEYRGSIVGISWEYLWDIAEVSRGVCGISGGYCGGISRGISR